jgi:hypothetical protein
VVAFEAQPLLARHETEPLAEFLQELLKAIDDSLLKVALKPGVAFGQIKKIEDKRVLDDVARATTSWPFFARAKTLSLSRLLAKRSKSSEATGPVLASNLDFVKGTGCWVLEAHQDEVVGPAEVGREERALDRRGFGQQRYPNLRVDRFGHRRCPFFNSTRIRK